MMLLEVAADVAMMHETPNDHRPRWHPPGPHDGEMTGCTKAGARAAKGASSFGMRLTYACVFARVIRAACEEIGG